MKLSEAKKLATQVVRAEIEGKPTRGHDGRKEFVLYGVRCTTRDGQTWVTRKRFSEFVTLKEQMQLAACAGMEAVKLPPKRVLRSNTAKVVEERISGLQHFLAKAIGMYADHGVLIQFLAQPVGDAPGASPNWRMKESRERLQQLREMVQDLREKRGVDDPTYQAMLAKLQSESRAFQAGGGRSGGPSMAASPAKPGSGGSARPSSLGAPALTSLARQSSAGGASPRHTIGTISELERDKELELRKGAMAHDRGLELQKQLQLQKRQSVAAATPAVKPPDALYNSGTFGKSYVLGRLLGEGKFGRVFQCTHSETGLVRAVKIVPTNQKGFQEADLLEETRLQNQCGGHPNIVQIFDLFKEKKALYLVQEVVGGGDLFSLVIRRQSAADAAGLESPFTEAAASKIIVQLVAAVAHCHELGVMHRDIKPENVLCLAEDEEQLKLCDFGLACEYDPQKLILKQAGSVEYAAPEVLTYGMGYTNSADVWSIGVVTYVLLCGRLPFRGSNPKAAAEAVQRMPLEFPSPEWDGISTEVKELLRDSMLNREPTERATAMELMEHPWLSGAAPDLPLGQTVSALKKYNANRRFKTAVTGVIMARRVQIVMREAFAGRQASEFHTNYTLEHVRKLCGAFSTASEEIHQHQSPRRSKSGGGSKWSQRRYAASHKNFIPIETFAEVLDSTLELGGETTMVTAHVNAFATGYLRRWVDYLSYLLGLATSFASSTDEKLAHAFDVLCELDEEGDGAVHLAEFVALIDSTQGLTAEHDEDKIHELFQKLQCSAGEEGDDGAESQLTAEQFVAAAKTTPELLRYFASIGLQVATIQIGESAAQSAAFSADLEARALQCSAGDIPASPPPVRLAPQTPPPIASPDLQPEPEALAEGSGGGQLDRTRGDRSPSPPPIGEERLFEMRRAFALFEAADGTVARADGWRVLQTLGEEDHSPEDFERLITPPTAARTGAVGRISDGALSLRTSLAGAAAAAGVTPAKDTTEDEGMSVSLADEFNITFEEFCRLIQVRDGKRRQAELRRALTPEDKARLMQNQ